VPDKSEEHAGVFPVPDNPLQALVYSQSDI
jgi:hypothetical protein